MAFVEAWGLCRRVRGERDTESRGKSGEKHRCLHTQPRGQMIDNARRVSGFTELTRPDVAIHSTDLTSNCSILCAVEANKVKCCLAGLGITTQLCSRR